MKFGEDAGRDRAVLKMQQNLFRFSGAKTYTQLVELNEKLTKDRKVIDWPEFKDEALKINDKYNFNHLQSEFQTVRQSGHHAHNWEQYQADIKLFPNLKYKTVGDNRVRDAHRVLEGTIAALDAPFWDKYYPPNGWRCRCYVVQTAEKTTVDIPGNVPEVKEEFRINVGKLHQVFNENKTGNPYFAILKSNKEAAQEVERQLVKSFREEVRSWAKEHITGKQEFKHKDLPSEFILSNHDIKTITGKPHENQTDRDTLIYNLQENLDNADFLFKVAENKGRKQYKTWYYFKAKEGKFYFNIVENSKGEFKLHAITDKIAKP